MPTPAEIAANASCFSCIPNQADALIYLFATIAGVPDPATIAANASCYSCIPNKQEALLYLANLIVTNGSAPAPTSDAWTCGAGPPTTPPASGCGGYIDTNNDAVYIYRLGAWVLKV